MIRRAVLALVLVLGATAFTAEASELGRRRPVTNPHITVDGVVASVAPEAFRVQTPSGFVSVILTPATKIERAGESLDKATIALGDYTLTEALVAPDGTISAKRVSLFTVPASAAASDTVRVEGKVAAVSPDSSELKLEVKEGAVLTVSVNETTVIRRGGQVIALREIEIGSYARIVGKPTGERTLLALEIDVHPAPPAPRDIVAGDVVEIRAAERTLVVRPSPHPMGTSADDLTFVRTDEKTEIFRRGEKIRFGDIHQGDFIVAQGELDSSKALLAARIDVHDPPAPAPKIAGRVLEISAAERKFTVAVERGWMDDSAPAPVTVIASDATKIYRDREPVRFDAIKPGDFVHVAGEWRDDRALVASEIYIVTPPPVPPMPAILGEIAQIEAATRTIIVRVRAPRPMETVTDGTVKVLVGNDTEIFRNGEPSRFEDLRIGEIVAVIGEVRDDGALLAKRIDVIVPPQRPGEVMGDVVAVGERSIEIIVPQPYPTFMEVRVTVVADNATEIVRNGEKVRLSAIQIGDVAVASGEWKDERTLLARKIEAKSRPVPPPVVLGVVVSISGMELSVVPGHPGMMRTSESHPVPAQPTIVRATAETEVYRGDVRIRFAEIHVGDFVSAEGAWASDGALLARVIKIVPTTQWLKGEIDTIDAAASTFMLKAGDRAILVRVTADTRITRMGLPIRFSALEPGKPVVVSGTMGSDGALTAASVDVIDMPPPPPPPPVVFMRGTIASVSPGGIRIETFDHSFWAILVTRETVITRAGAVIALADLRIGELVELAGSPSGDHTITALKIAVVGR